MSKKRITWKIEKRKLADLKPHPKNPRQFTEKGMKDLENSINSIGFMQPININQDGTILSGHARTLKLQQMGEIEVDEKYCDVIVKRYIKFCITNNIPVSVKRNGQDCKQEFIEKND